MHIIWNTSVCFQIIICSNVAEVLFGIRQVEECSSSCKHSLEKVVQVIIMHGIMTAEE